MMDDDALGEKLSHGWQLVHQQAGQAIEWLSNAKRSSNTVANEAPELVHKLRQIRNQAAKLGPVSKTGSTIGFFGLSQAGKSYLISALMAGTDGDLKTRLDGHLLDFIDHVNPPGGGAEATGLVTRFAKSASEAPAGFPLKLQLFSETEIVKVLINAFMEDFNQQKIGHSFDGEPLELANKAIRAAIPKKQAQRSAGVSEDDMVDLWDYLKMNYPGKYEPLMNQFVPELVDLVPYLPRTERTELFSVLWANLGGLTACFDMLSRTLEKLNHPKSVFTSLDALVAVDQGSGAIRQKSDSIMSVSTLFKLGQKDDTSLEVMVGTPAGKTVEVSRAEIAALTAETHFPLENTPTQEALNSVDILDFPGYRGRLKLDSFEDGNQIVQDTSANPSKRNRVAELLLRGKVAFLFQRYTDMQEMNVLVICAASHKQSEVSDVGPVLDRWVKETHGSSPQERSARQSGLVWAMTMFDEKIKLTLDGAEGVYDQVCHKIIEITLTEKFSGSEWLNNWLPNQPFNCSFPVRKPGLAPFIECNDGVETHIKPDRSEKVQNIAKAWASNSNVQRHVAHPEQAWQAMLELNDGGISRLSKYLSEVAVRSIKLGRLREQLDKVIDKLAEGRLNDWYNPSGADEVQLRTQRADEIGGQLGQIAKLLALLQKQMLLPSEKIRSLYLNSEYTIELSADGDNPDNASASPFAGDLGLGSGVNLFSPASSTSSPQQEDNRASTSTDARFGRTVYHAWITHLKDLPDDDAFINYLKLLQVDRRVIEHLVSEIVIALDRFDFETKLINKLIETEQSGTKRERLVERQTLTVQTQIGDFLAWLGQNYLPVEERKFQNEALFVPPPRVSSGALPSLGETPGLFSDLLRRDWLRALHSLITNNAGHDAGRDISPELNVALGDILKQLKDARITTS
jgi:hypothetical protein